MQQRNHGSQTVSTRSFATQSARAGKVRCEQNGLEAEGRAVMRSQSTLDPAASSAAEVCSAVMCSLWVLLFVTQAEMISSHHCAMSFGMPNHDEKARRMGIRRDIGNRKPSVPPPLHQHSGEYLVAHACFSCRKSFKISPNAIDPICPQCSGVIVIMGRSFKVPKSNNIEQWLKVQRLWEAGFRFWSYRSYDGAEPLPEKLSEVDAFIERNPDHPMRISK